jgi:hypothetical protein
MTPAEELTSDSAEQGFGTGLRAQLDRRREPDSKPEKPARPTRVGPPPEAAQLREREAALDEREAAMGAREAELAARERGVAERELEVEAELAAYQRRLAEREQGLVAGVAAREADLAEVERRFATRERELETNAARRSAELVAEREQLRAEAERIAKAAAAHEAFAAADEERRLQLDQREAVLITREADLSRREAEISQTELELVRSRDLDALEARLTVREQELDARLKARQQEFEMQLATRTQAVAEREEAVEALLSDPERVRNYLDYPWLRDFDRELMRDLNPVGVPRAIREVIEDWPLRDREDMRKVTAPTLLICREGDVIHPAEVGRILAGIMPKAELMMFEDGMSMYGAIPQIVERVRDFILG